MTISVPSNYVPLLQQMSSGTGIPYDVLAAQANLESGFNANAVSPSGAEGWLQFLPSTYQGVAAAAGVPANSEFTPSDEAKAYIVFMNQLLSQEGGDLTKALEAYNAGPGNLSAGAGYAAQIESAAGSGDVTVPGSGTTPASTTGSILGDLLPNAASITSGIMDTILSAFGLPSMKDLIERLGLILLGAALVILGISIFTKGSSSKQPFNIQVTSEETPEGTKRSRTVNTPVGKHTRTVKTQGSQAGKTAGSAQKGIKPLTKEGSEGVASKALESGAEVALA
jgi:Transglycosylase SLT domain